MLHLWHRDLTEVPRICSITHSTHRNNNSSIKIILHRRSLTITTNHRLDKPRTIINPTCSINNMANSQADRPKIQQLCPVASLLCKRCLLRIHRV